MNISEDQKSEQKGCKATEKKSTEHYNLAEDKIAPGGLLVLSPSWI